MTVVVFDGVAVDDRGLRSGIHRDAQDREMFLKRTALNYFRAHQLTRFRPRDAIDDDLLFVVVGDLNRNLPGSSSELELQSCRSAMVRSPSPSETPSPSPRFQEPNPTLTVTATHPSTENGSSGFTSPVFWSLPVTVVVPRIPRARCKQPPKAWLHHQPMTLLFPHDETGPSPHKQQQQ